MLRKFHSFKALSQFGEQEAMCRTIEEAFLIFAVPGSWFYLMFFCGAIKLTGPFVTMIFKMVTGDMFTFSIVYSICLLGFSQAFFFIIKSHEDASLYAEYHTTWIGLFHMTLGEYDYGMLGSTPYPKMAKVVFVIFQVTHNLIHVERDWMLNLTPGADPDPLAQHVDCHDGEHLRDCHRVRGERVPQSLGQGRNKNENLCFAKSICVQVIMSLERSVTEAQAKEYIESYSIGLGPSER